MSRLVSESEMAERFQQSVGEWSARTFPGSGPGVAMSHLREEIGELDEALKLGYAPDISAEIADCYLLLCVLSHQLDINMRAAAARKYAEISQAEWYFDVERGHHKRVKP